MLFLWLGAAIAGDTPAIASCQDTPQAGDVKWAIARTVLIETESGSGSGVLVSGDGFVLTAAHVLSGAETFEVTVHGGQPQTARLVRANAESDLALLHVDVDGTPCVSLRTSMADVGDDLIVIGSPGGEQLSHSVAKGIVSSYREADGVTLVQTDAAINLGNSGGPMIGPSGELVGVVSFKLVGDAVEGLGFGIASSDIAQALNIRWGTETDPALLSEDATVAPLAPSIRYPDIDLNGSDPISTDVAYTMNYRPRKGLVWLGVGLAAAGGGGVAATNIQYNNARKMPLANYRTLQAANVGSVTVVALGAGVVALGLLPSNKGDVAVVPTPDGEL